MRSRRITYQILIIGLVSACTTSGSPSTSPAASPEGSASTTASARPAGDSSAPSVDPAASGSPGLTLDLTLAGPHINERLKTGLIPESGETWCNWQASQSDPAVVFPASILIDPRSVAGKGWSSFEFMDQDGPASQSSGELDLAVIDGAGRLHYKWAPGSGTKALSKGSATYSSDDKSVLFDIYAYDAKSGEQGYTHVTGSILCAR